MGGDSTEPDPPKKRGFLSGLADAFMGQMVGGPWGPANGLTFLVPEESRQAQQAMVNYGTKHGQRYAAVMGTIGGLASLVPGLRPLGFALGIPDAMYDADDFINSIEGASDSAGSWGDVAKSAAHLLLDIPNIKAKRYGDVLNGLGIEDDGYTAITGRDALEDGADYVMRNANKLIANDKVYFGGEVPAVTIIGDKKKVKRKRKDIDHGQ